MALPWILGTIAVAATSLIIDSITEAQEKERQAERDRIERRNARREAAARLAAQEQQQRENQQKLVALTLAKSIACRFFNQYYSHDYKVLSDRINQHDSLALVHSDFEKIITSQSCTAVNKATREVEECKLKMLSLDHAIDELNQLSDTVKCV